MHNVYLELQHDSGANWRLGPFVDDEQLDLAIAKIKMYRRGLRDVTADSAWVISQYPWWVLVDIAFNGEFSMTKRRTPDQAIPIEEIYT